MITLTLALDAGKRKVYGAVANGSEIIGLRDFDPEKPLDVLMCNGVVLERQNINANTPNWQNTLDCERAGQRVAGRMRAPVVEYTAAQWKGSIKKPPHHYHLWRILSPPERKLLGGETVYNTIQLACDTLAKTGKVINYSFAQNNRLDAAALLMFELGRLGRGGQRVC